MKKLLVILFLLITSFGFGQSVNAPEPKVFTINTAAQDASGFSLSGFGATETLLASISLINPPSGTTFYLDRLDGLTPASGFTLPGNKTRLVVTGTMANINIALANLKVNTGATVGNVQLSIAATVNPVGFFYNGVNGHFYRPITATNERTTYTNARSRSLLTTFKGQTGYLVTITSTSEEEFIRVNVPATNVWFAATDEVVDGRWVIDAGPERGTVMKTQNGQLNGNIAGVYNNWCGGEPNGFNGSENYAVAKWNGAACWNDLSNNWNNPYVIEYGTWADPDDQTFTEFYSNSVNHSNGNILRTEFNFNFGSNVDETMFRTRILTSNDNTTFSSNNSFINLNGIGRVNMTSQMDTVQISNGFKAIITPGQVEWSLINPYEASRNGHRLQIDEREFQGTGINLNNIKSVQLFDIYDGPMTPLDFGGWWKQWLVPGNIDLASKVAASSFQSNIRLQDGWYAFRAEYTFTESKTSKFHRLEFGSLPTTQNASLLSNIVTVADVYLAFREFADRGLMGNESKYFTSGIQFHNADVNNDRIFDERDCYELLTHLQGTTSLWSTTPNIGDAMKLIPSINYDSITKQNWNTIGNLTRINYPFTFTNGILNSYNLDVTWKGDVNLSHSAQPTEFTTTSVNSTQSVKSMSTSTVSTAEADIMMEKQGDEIVAIIVVSPNGNQIGATQFNVFFDNSLLEYKGIQSTTTQSTNFSKNNGSFISVGSLNTSGGSISNIGYKVIFKPKTTISNMLGLISIQNVETLGINLNKLNIRIK